MDFTIDKQEASKALQLIKLSISQRPTHPILGSVFVEADETQQQVRFTGSDLAIFAVIKAEASVRTGGKAAIPANLLLPIIGKQPDGDVRIVSAITQNEDSETQSFKISIEGTGIYDIAGNDPSDYPDFPAIPTNEVSLSAKDLKSGIRTTGKFVSSDETKQVLTGVRISAMQGNLEFAATDGHRLAMEKFPNANQVNFPGITVPGKALSLVEKVIGSEPVVVAYNEDQISFTTDKAFILVRALSGAYPPYNNLIPRGFSTTFVLPTKEFLASVERIAILSDNLVVLTLAEGEVTISSESNEYGNARESIATDLKGESLQFGIKTKYLIEALKTIETHEVKISLNTPVAPVVLSPLGVQDQTFLIMPINLVR